MTIRKKYIETAKEYEKKFAEITDKQGYWDDDYDLWITEYEAWSYSDMRYIVDNRRKLYDRYGLRYNLVDERELEKLLCIDIEEWIDYNVDVATFGIQYINLKSWLAGAPRVSKERLERLKALKREFEEACKQEQSVYGKLYEGSQPEHLRNLKSKDYEGIRDLSGACGHPL